MARSYRKTPIAGITTARSEKWWKRSWHKKYRSAVRQAIHHGDEVMPHYREVSDPWGGPKDGKVWFGGRRGAWRQVMRK